MLDRNFNRILLPQIPLFEEISPQHIQAHGRLLPFLLEELISLGVVEIIIRDSWRYKQQLMELPQGFRNRVVISNTRKPEQIAIKLFEPFFEEFGLEARAGAVRHLHPAQDQNRTIIDAGVSAFFDLPEFLYALTHKAQVQFDPADIVKNLTLLRDGSRSPEMRANASVLIGIFASYQRVMHDSVVVRGVASQDLVQRFIDFTEDVYYKELSKEVHALGIFKTAMQAIPKINRAARKFLETKANKQLIDFGARAVTVATGVPLPGSSLAESLLSEQYLPPVVDLRSVVSKAKKTWAKSEDDRSS
jgi:hypothetical protein